MKKVVSVGTTLNLREKPAKNSKILGKLPDGLEVEVDDAGKGWFKLNMPGKYPTGYLSAEFLADKTASVGNKTSEPAWLSHARKYIGLAEVPGTKHNPTIVGWWSKISAAFRDDETAWCAGFVGGVFEEVGVKSSKSAAARSYMKWGVKLNAPAVGSVVVYERGNNGWSGHVGFVVGKDAKGNIMTLGGNQSNKVSIAPFGTSRVLGYYWPKDVTLPVDFRLPVLNSNGKVSTNEA